MKTVIELAQECLLIGMRPHLDGIYQEALEKFAALVAAQEREACYAIVYGQCESDNAAQRIVDAIRKRGTT